MENLLGVILCGGQSKRMGSDKGLLLRENKPWALIVAETLKTADLEVVASINKAQQESYSKILVDIPTIVDSLPLDGPLEGLLSVHKAFPGRDILLMACDLVDMEKETIINLIRNYQENPDFEYFVYEQNGFTQPFCAIYTSGALGNVYEQFERKELKNYSLHNRFEAGKTMYIQVSATESFNNYNSPDNIKGQR